MANSELDVIPTIGWICLDATNPEVLADWWSRLLDGGVKREPIKTETSTSRWGRSRSFS